jgi:catechol 2,3-dioxygenase
MKRTGGGRVVNMIAAETGVGAVHISVREGGRARDFYRDVVGLEVIDEDGPIHLGAAGMELLVLYPGAAEPAPGGTTGLYHFAILVPSRRELARLVARLMALRYPHGPTDHVMTKSDYFSDPDGNGIEIYAETPEDGTWFVSDDGFWAEDASGVRRSGRDPIDLDALFAELSPDDAIDAPLPAGTKMGHVHLHVRDIDEAVVFWSDLIGFDVMGRSRRFGAAFVSAGGYHHHIGLNTWAGPGAPPPPPEASGLRHFTVEVPTASDLRAVEERLKGGGVPTEPAEDSGFFARDPSGNHVHMVARPSSNVK